MLLIVTGLPAWLLVIEFNIKVNIIASTWEGRRDRKEEKISERPARGGMGRRNARRLFHPYSPHVAPRSLLQPNEQ